METLMKQQIPTVKEISEILTSFLNKEGYNILYNLSMELNDWGEKIQIYIQKK